MAHTGNRLGRAMGPRRALLILLASLAIAACGSGAVAPGSSAPAPTSAASSAASSAPSGAPSAASSLATIGQPADNGARIVKVDQLRDRVVDLTIESPSVGTGMVRLLLPRDFEAGGTGDYPVLLLLHGAGGEYVDWTDNTEIEATMAPTNLLTVMPAGASSSSDGWYTNWKASGGDVGPEGAPQWETFHIDELLPLLERNWQAGDERAVAGLSMGGYGSMTYAGRHPDLFQAAASYSGALDLREDADELTDGKASQIWGDPVTDSANWDAHDPVKLIPMLTGKDLFISWGSGEPGPLDPPGTDQDRIETRINQGNERFVEKLEEAGIPVTVDFYGPGTHSWGYWDRELRKSLPLLLKAVNEPSP
jgi:S-formylglutathione hydrolase FrmB